MRLYHESYSKFLKHRTIVFGATRHSMAQAIRCSVRVIVIPNGILVHSSLHSRSFLAVDYKEAISCQLYKLHRAISVYRFRSEIMLLDVTSSLHVLLSRNGVIKVEELRTEHVPVVVQFFQMLVASDKFCKSSLTSSLNGKRRFLADQRSTFSLGIPLSFVYTLA